MIFIVDDDRDMAECLALACRPEKVQIFSNAIEAINALDDEMPRLIFLDILLDGPDGFTFLNELVSYTDTAKIPIVIVSSLELKLRLFKEYGVVKILDKTTMTPEEVRKVLDEQGD